MRTIEFTAVIECAETDTSVVIEVEYDRDFSPVETRVYIPCPHDGCKKHRMDITPIITDYEWTKINDRIPQEILMWEQEHRR